MEKEGTATLKMDADQTASFDFQAKKLQGAGISLPLSAIVIATIGYAGLGFQPVLVSSLIEAGEFSPDAAGYVASAEVFGIAAASLATALKGNQLSWRLQCFAGLMLLIAGVVASVMAGSDVPGMMAARFISGLGSGLLISRGYAAAGLSPNPDRMLGYLLAASTAHVAVGSLLLPKLIAQWGLATIFIYFGVLACTGLPFIRWIPVRSINTTELKHSGSTLTERLAALVAAALFFMGLGVLWAYLFQVGLSMGASADEAAAGLSVSQIAAFGGALVAALAGRKIPAFSMLLFAYVVTIGSVSLFPMLSGGLAYAVLAAGFNGGSNTAMVLVLGAVAEADIDGRWIAAAVASQTLGFAFGPAMAALMMSDKNFLIPEIMSVALILASCAATIIAALAVRSRRTPQFT
jgi:hypothetical protein